MMKLPEVSVIIPVYNVAPFLRGCIDSVCAQTYEALEILLVDDGSTDGSGGICDAYAALDARVTVLHQDNSGVSCARNAGMNAARGEWIAFVDADDQVEPDMIEFLVELAEKYETSAAQCGILAYENGTATELFCCSEPCVLSLKADRDWRLLANSTCNKLYRAEAVRGIFYDTEYPIGEDLLFNLCLLQRGGTVVCGSEAKYRYLQRDGSACRSAPTLRQLTSYREVLDRILEITEQYPAATAFFRAEWLRNELDMCSKIVRFPSPEFREVRDELRCELRARTKQWLWMRDLSAKERTKLFLAAWAWGLYKGMLLLSKKLR